MELPLQKKSGERKGGGPRPACLSGRLAVVTACLLKEEGTQLTGQASMIIIKTLT